MTQKVSKSSIKVSHSWLRRLAALFVLFFAAQGVWGTDYTWNGSASDGLWNNQENWTPNGIPGVNDQVTLTGDEEITLSNNTSVKFLFIFSGTNSSTIKLNGFTLTVASRIRLGQNTIGHLILENGTVTTKEFDTEDDGTNSLTLKDVNFSVTEKLLLNGTGTTTVSGGTGTTNTFNISSGVTFYDDSAGVITFGNDVTVNSAVTVWNGKTSTDWNNNANWAFGVPSVNSEVLIAATTRSPVLTSVTPSLSKLTIAANAKLTLDTGASLQATTITNNGELTIKAGSISGTTLNNGDNSTIIYDGISAPVWSNTYNNLTINSGTLTIPDAITINKTFTISADFTNNAEITAKGNVTSTNNMSGTGKITFAGSSEQTFAGGGKQYSNVEIKNNVIITGNNEFGTLAVNSIGGKTINFGATTQTVTSNLTLKGSGTGNRLALTGTGWELNCTGTSDIQYTNIEKSTATSPLIAKDSIDNGNNSNWSFPGQTYTWTGTSDTDWFNSSNWDKNSIPGYGSNVIINATAAGPVLTTRDVSLNYSTYTGTITIKPGATFDLAGRTVTAGQIINNGHIKLNGIENQITGTMSEGTETGADPTVEYTGTGTTTYFVWDSDNNASNGKQYKKLILNRTGAEVTENLVVSGELNISKAVSIASTGSVSAKGNVTSTADVTGAGKLIFTGEQAQVFAAGSKSYSNIEKTGNSSLAINEGFNTITNFTNPSGSGSIVFNAGGTITGDVNFQTTGTVTLDGAFITKNLSFNGPATLKANTNMSSSVAATYTATTIELAGNVTFSSATGIELSVTKITGTSPDYKLINNGTLTLSDGITVETAIENSGTFSCSNAVFANDVDLSGGTSFTHSAGTIELTASKKSPAILSGANTFVNIKISGSVKITGSNIFTDFTATELAGKTITFTDSTKQTVNGSLKLSGKTGNSNKLNLTSSGSGKWEIDSVNAPDTLAFLSVTNSDNKSTDNSSNIILFTASSSTDNGGNVNWAFPGQTYQWQGEAAEGSKTNWQNALNWSPASLPGSGAIITIPAVPNNYPQLSANVDIGTGTIAIANNASLDMNGYNFSAATISNSGKVLLKGNETIQGTITNANTSTVEYYGTNTLTAFNWKNGQFYNLILSQPVDISDAIQVTGATQILAGTGTVNLDNANNVFNGAVTIGNSTTSAGTVTLSGKKTNGTAITLADGVYAAALTLNSNVQGADLTINAPLTVNAATITTTGNQTYNDTVLLKAATTTFSAASGKTIEFTATVTGEAGTEGLVTSGGTAVFDANVNVGSLSTQAATIKNAVTITTLAGDTINFSGAITGSGSLTTSTGNVIFNGTVSGLSSITANAGAKINTASITTTGTQTYNGAITLAPGGRQTTLTASGDGSQILLKADVGSTNSSSLTTAGVLIIGNNGGSGINVSVPLTVQNDTYFYSENTLTSLTATSMGGKSITFEAGKTQTFSGKLSLAGANGSLLSLKSSGAGTAWKIKCTGSDNHSINYVDVKDSDNSQTLYYLTASNSTDSGNNTNWAFPDMAYTWTGANNSTDWSDPQNWSPQSVPNAGNGIQILAGKPEYPVIDETVALAQTTITIESGASFGVTTSGDFTAGTITNGGTIEVSDGTLTVTTLVNNQTVNLTGGQIVIPNTSGATFTNNSTVNISGGTITGTRNNGNDSVVIYNGTGDTSPVWGNDYKNLQIDNGCSVSFANDITVANGFTNNGSASIAASKKINVAGNVTSTGDITGDGTLNFNGTSDQTFTPNNKNYPAITASAAGSGSLIIDGKLNAVSINSARTTKLNDTITTTGSQIYNGAVILEGNTELTASEIQFLSTVSGEHSLTTSGTTRIKGNITTKGGQTYNNSVVLLAGVTLTDDADQLVKFVSDVSGAYALTISGANSEFGSTVSGITTLITDADTEFKDTVTVGSLSAVNANINCASITTSTTQTYSGNLTLTQSPTFSGTALTFGGDVKSSATGTGRTITFDKCTSVNNSSASVSDDISYEFKNSSASTVTTAFTQGSSIYHDITSQNITLNFGNNAFTQASGSTFTVNSGIVNMGSGGVALGNLTVEGGIFRQTGEADDSVNNITFNSGTIIWDSGDAGGTLAINGTISGAAAANINYHQKEVTINATQSVSGVFWSLVIPAGVSITNGDSIRIRKNLTIESTGSYVHNDKTLIFGTDAEDGEISDENSSSVNLGSVVLNKTSADSKLQAKTNLLFTDLTVTKGTFDIPSGKTVQTTNLTIETNGKLANAETLNVTGNMTDSGTYSGDGTIYFTGTGNQDFTPKAGTAALHTTYKNIVNTSANPLNIKADIWAENFTIGSGKTTTFEGKADITNLTITSAQNTIFQGEVTIENITDNAAAGNISFTDGGTITNDVDFATTGTVTFEGTTHLADLTHTAAGCSTVINGTVEAANITLGNTSGNNITITNTGLFKTTDGASLEYTTGFTQNGSGNSILGGSFSGTGNAVFAQNVYLYGSSAADFGSSTTDNTITVAKNLIISRTAALAINDSVTCDQNIVIYKGAVTADANITSGLDVIILGANYSTEDTSTGIADEYAYNANRPGGWSTPQYNETTLPDGNAVPVSGFTSTLTVSSAKSIHVGKNFYANGTSLTGSAEWFIDILSNADSQLCFAEAYISSFTNCTVRKHTGGTSAEEDDENAQIMAEACTIAANCKHFDNTDFEIVETWTTRDNVVYVKFNRAVRNLYGELNLEIANFKYFNTADCDTSYSGFFINEDGSTVLENGSEVEVVYLKSEDDKNWNTDATGTTPGVANSTDRNGTERTAIPYIDIPRATASASFIVTDRFGKRLKHYSGASRITTVLDKTGPVLVEVRTGQETHETNLANQAAYDAHNFIEFIYSEPVNFGNSSNASDASKKNTLDWIPAYETGISGTANTPQNIQISDTDNTLGHLTSSTDLTFEGLNQKIASGKMHTKQADSDTQSVNALYRQSTHSIKYSLAGYVSNEITASGITYKNWQGYIEEAVLPSGVVTRTETGVVENQSVTDCAVDIDGITPLYNPQIMNKTGLTVDNSEQAGTNYGGWDTQAPEFVKGHKHGKDNPEDFYEALGNGDGSTLNRIEIHISDNPSSADSFNKYWLTGYGWTTDPSGTLLSSAADDLVGGSRPFDSSTSNVTKGGIRYCTIKNNEAAVINSFKYEVGATDTPSQNFTAIAESASAPFFTGASDTRNNIPLEKDNTYISLSLSDTSLPYKTTFTISYDSTSSYITDLAGNRLKDETIKTIDLTSPDYKISFSPVNQNKIFLIFLKELTDDIKYNNNSIPESFEEIIPYCFELGTISGSTWTSNNGTALQIDTSVPASIIRSKSNSYFTAIELTLNRDVTMNDIETTYIRLKNAIGYNEKSKDPITGLDNSYVTFIQDVVGNYMPMYQAHALSDFAANMVNPLYAYNDDIEYREENLTYSLYEPESWAVHDWNKEQQNYGTLLAQKPVTVIADVDTSYFADASGDLQYTLRMFYSKNPTAGSESDEYNADIHDSLRLWAPDNSNFANNGLFPAYAAVTNQNYDYVDAVPLDTDLSKGVEFNFTETIAQNFTHGSQISFLFGVFDSGVQKSICLNPVLTMSGGSASYNVSAQTPLYIIRLKNPGDITSLDLWSFRVKSVAAQRGNVSIMNNVINADKGEKVVIKVDLKQKGNLNVLVMTLDGNIVDYLQRGEAEEGEHFYSWDGTNRRGKTVARGMYFVRVTGPGIDETRKVLVVK